MLNLTSAPQALQTGYASRLRMNQTTLFVSTKATTHGHKRGSAAAAYAEFDGYDDDDDDDDPSFDQASPGGMHRGQDAVKVEVKKPAQPTRHAVYTEAHMRQLADSDEVLVPIRLSLDVEHYRVSDFFLWNANEPVLTPEQFAIITCQDLELSVGYTSNIANAIKTQLSEYAELASLSLPEGTSVRVVLNLSVILDKELYEDRVEWDLGDGSVTPHEFAKTVAADMSLEPEFVPAIAHSVTEALLRLKRDYIEERLPPKIANQNMIAPGSISRNISEAGLRYDPDDLGDDWTPTKETLTQSELERREMERERMIRRMKRESARAGDFELGSLMGRKRRRRDSPASPW